MNDWIRGIKKGLPIAIGYLSVSFTFGVKAVNAGIPVWITILISVANVTSAGSTWQLFRNGNDYVYY